MTPAEQLTGLKLENGWKVETLLPRKPNSTGGHFSQGYIVVNEDGRSGFLKALDYFKAFGPTPAIETIQYLINAFVFEKKLCEKVGHLSRIVRAIDGGAVHLNASDPFTRVEYLIFELAEGDIRSKLDLQDKLDTVFALNAIHQITVGLSQLHNSNIAHQDLKPSNILHFSGTTGTKISDLGHAWDRDIPSPNDPAAAAGDQTYLPIEYWYRVVPPDDATRRFGCDLYRLGSLIVFIFTRAHLNALIFTNLAQIHRPIVWGGTYEEVLPFVQAAFDLAVNEFVEQLPIFLQNDLRALVTSLCNPDLRRRGDTKRCAQSQFSLERSISRLNWMAHKAKLEVERWIEVNGRSK